MAREVNATLGKIIAAERGLTESQGEEVVKKLRNSNLYQVCLVPFFRFWGRSVPANMAPRCFIAYPRLSAFSEMHDRRLTKISAPIGGCLVMSEILNPKSLVLLLFPLREKYLLQCFLPNFSD